MTAQLVTYTADGRVGIITLNRPDKLNAISVELKQPADRPLPRGRPRPRDRAWSCSGRRGGASPPGTTSVPTRPGPRGAGNALAWHESLTDDVRARDDAVGHEKARDRLGARDTVSAAAAS